MLVGRDEGDEEKITAVIQDSGLGEEVAIVGEVSDQELADWYAKADVFVLFSHY